MHSPRILVFDSGLGGLTVFREIAKALPEADYVYAADDAGFPYGAWAADDLVWRVLAVMRRLIAETKPDVAVIACNTASTLVLPHLRAAFDIPFVGTVPAIKPAAERSQSKLISVLATPGTVARDYTRDLISAFAAHCAVQLVGSQNLARLAEDFMRGARIADADIFAEIEPCFVAAQHGRTDHVVLACTHYPLLIDAFVRLAPWPVEWLDPAPAIARRVAQVLTEREDTRGVVIPAEAERRAGTRKPAYDRWVPDRPSAVRDDDCSPHAAIFTSGRAPDAALAAALRGFGLAAIDFAPMPAERQAAL